MTLLIGALKPMLPLYTAFSFQGGCQALNQWTPGPSRPPHPCRLSPLSVSAYVVLTFHYTTSWFFTKIFEFCNLCSTFLTVQTSYWKLLFLYYLKTASSRASVTCQLLVGISKLRRNLHEVQDKSFPCLQLRVDKQLHCAEFRSEVVKIRNEHTFKIS